MDFLAKNEEETAQMAHDFGMRLGPNTDSAQVIGLYGELGAGKTTFMKYLAKSLGIEETIQSPTFVIMKRYELRGTRNEARKSYLVPRTSFFNSLIHIDAYRIENDSEMLNLGWKDMIKNPKNIICVEWPERIENIIPKHTKIFFEHVSENKRRIKIES